MTRKGTGTTMKQMLALLLCCAPVFGAISGTVLNRSTGTPQPGAAVEFIKIGQQTGMEVAGQTKSDANGAFTIPQDVEGSGLIRVVHDGVTYTQILSPGAANGITVEVYNAAQRPGASKVSKHMILFEPSGGQLAIQETLLVTNSGNTTWNDAGGTVRFYLPPAAGGQAQVSGVAPGGMSVGAGMVKTSQADVYAVQFPIKPGESRINVTYTVPYAEGSAYEGKIASEDDNTYLIAPQGVTLKGENLNDLGAEPQTQSQIFGLRGNSYRIQLTGAAAPAAGAEAADDGAPQIEVIMPRLYGRATLILGLALGILALGFAVLYRSRDSSAEETNERGRN